jgi:CheY-like chemotaxis protein
MTNGSCPASILVVEDDEDIRDAIGDILENEGYEIALAENGQHALEVLGKLSRPCLLLVDLLMPRMDGWELIKALAGDDRLATIPVVLMSGLSDSARLAGHVVIKKPIDLAILLEIVHEHCCGERGPAPDSNDLDRITPTGG